MQIVKAYCQNGPLHGRTLIVKELLEMQLHDGFYIRNEHPGSTPLEQKCPFYSWVGVKDWDVEVHISDNIQQVTVDAARVDRHGVMWMRLRKIGIEPDLYLLWKETADNHTDMSVVFRGEKYKGRTDVTGKNDIDGYMFLHFQGQKSDP